MRLLLFPCYSEFLRRRNTVAKFSDYMRLRRTKSTHLGVYLVNACRRDNVKRTILPIRREVYVPYLVCTLCLCSFMWSNVRMKIRKMCYCDCVEMWLGWRKLQEMKTTVVYGFVTFFWILGFFCGIPNLSLVASLDCNISLKPTKFIIQFPFYSWSMTLGSAPSPPFVFLWFTQILLNLLAYQRYHLKLVHYILQEPQYL